MDEEDEKEDKLIFEDFEDGNFMNTKCPFALCVCVF